MTTIATIGMRIPSCGLMSAASAARIAARSGRSRHSSRRASSSTTTPTESTWPQTTLSNQVTGFTSTISAPIFADRSLPAELPHHRPHEVGEREVAEDRRDLDQVADAADDVPDAADEPQDVQVAGRVVVKKPGRS